MPSIRSWGRSSIVPFTFSGSGQFDEDEAFELFFVVPESVSIIDELALWVRFREFWSTSTSAAGSTTPSGGGATSGGYDLGHSHVFARHLGAGGGGGTLRNYEPGFNAGGVNKFDLTANTGTANLSTSTVGDTHTHSVPAHTHASHVHALVYGLFREALPASFNVALTVHRRNFTPDDDEDDPQWGVVHQTTLTDEEQDLDLAKVLGNNYLGPGLWRLALQSNSGQPNAGRLGVDLTATAMGSIASMP